MGAECDESASPVVPDAEPALGDRWRRLAQIERRRTGRAELGPRSRSVTRRSLTRAALAIDHVSPEELAQLEALRPRTRAECADGVRPCPYVSCRHHLYLDVNPETGSIKLNFPDLEPDEIEHSCALDVADEGGRTLEAVGKIVNLTRERIRQVETRALLRIDRSKLL